MSDTAPWFTLPPPPTSALTASTVLIIGAGLGGSWLARTLAEHGVQSTVVESNEIASGASGNAVGVVKPFVTRTPGFTEYFYDKAFACLLQRLDGWRLSERCAFTPCGVLQLCDEPFPERESCCSLGPIEASERAGVDISSHALWFSQGGFLDPRALCHALLEHPLIKVIANNEVSQIDTSDQSACITLADAKRLHADVVILATGSALTRFSATRHLPVIPARGQTSDFRCDSPHDMPRCVISGKHYVIPGRNNVTTGATFLRNDSGTELRNTDHKSNLNGLRELLPGLAVESFPVDGHAGVRATTPDRLPLLGPVPDAAATDLAYRDLHHGRPQHQYPDLPTVPRLMLFGGLGSRGIVTAPYCAQLLVDYLFDADTSVDSLKSYASLLNPVRFQIRELKRRR